MIKSRFLALLGLLLSSAALANDGGEVEMADALMSNGKIYIVLICVLIVLSGLLLVLVRMEKKISQLEKQLNAHKS